MNNKSTAVGCKCSVCDEWQQWTPSGMVCKNGHGGVQGINTRLWELPDKPMFWVRLRSDGGYEGPIHDDVLEEVRKKSGAWTPLYTK